MAYIVNVTETATVTTGSTYTVTLGAHATNDLLLVFLTQDNGTGVTAPAGWTMVGTQAASAGASSAVGYKIAASGAEANPVFTGTNDDWIGTCVVIRDVDTTTPINKWQRTDWNLVSSIASNPPAAGSSGVTAVTPSVDNCLLMYFGMSDTNAQVRYRANDLVCDDKNSTSGALVHVVGHRQQGTAAQVPSITLYSNTAAEGGNVWVIVVANKANGTLQADCRAGVTEVNPYGDFGLLSHTVTWLPPVDIDGTGGTLNIDGVACSTIAATATTGTADLIYSWGTMTTLASTEVATSAGLWVGGCHAISSTDMSGKVFAVQWAMNSQTASRIAPRGAIVVFADGSGNWAAYTLGLLSSIVSSVSYQTYIGIGTSTALATSGSIDWTAVTKIGYFHDRIDTSATSIGLMIKNAVLLGPAIVTGGGTSSYASVTTVPNTVGTWGNYTYSDLQGGGQVLAKGSVQIGDGSVKTIFASAASSIEYPIAYNNATGNQKYWNAGALTGTITVKASANDSIDMSASVIASVLAQSFSIDASSSTSATYSFAGTSIVGYTVTWKTGITCANVTFKSGAIIDFKGATISNVIANSGTGTAICSASNGFSATGCAFTASATAVYGIRISAAGTFSLDSTTFSGFTKDIDVTAAVGTVTINLAAGQATPTYQTAGATVTIVSSPVFQSVAVTGLAAGSQLQIYDVTSSTELYNGNVAGTSHTWTDGSPAAASRAIRLRIANVGSGGAGAYNFIDANVGTCGTTAGTETVSYLANQSLDTTYNSNAIDGSLVTGITITPSPARVKINLVGGTVTWANIYAYHVYWLSTATGIADEAAFIDAPDTANYLLTGFDVRNDSATPLTLTGGWGRDAVTLTVAGCIDVAGSTGNIYAEPDHVVAYATASGLTPQETADLSTAASSAASAATAATLARKLLSNKRVLDVSTGIETIYDDSGVALYTRNVYVDKNGATPYSGTQAPHRVEKYA